MKPNSLARSTVNHLGSYFQTQEQLTKLRLEMVKLFNESELRDLCFDLQVNYDALPGSGTNDKCRELILYCLSRGRLAELVAACADRRPNFDADDYFPEEEPEAADFESGAVIYERLNDHLGQEAYYLQTLARLAERPDSSGRQSALNGLLLELMEDDPALTRLLNELFGEKESPGGNITQKVKLSGHAKAGDINQIGKVEGSVDIDALLKKKKK